MSRFGLSLPGWEQRSVWGWDEGLGSYYAQLYRNDQPTDEADTPHVWLSGIAPAYPSRHALAHALATAVRLPVAEVLAALESSMTGTGP